MLIWGLIFWLVGGLIVLEGCIRWGDLGGTMVKLSHPTLKYILVAIILITWPIIGWYVLRVAVSKARRIMREQRR